MVGESRVPARLCVGGINGIAMRWMVIKELLRVNPDVNCTDGPACTWHDCSLWLPAVCTGEPTNIFQLLVIQIVENKDEDYIPFKQSTDFL
jgi:hypothetical protein